MNKAIGMAVVLAAAIAIFLVFRSSSSSDEASGASSSKASSQDHAESLANDNGGNGAGHSDQATPRPLRMSATNANASTDSTRNYIRDDGTAVRDHRSEAVGENYERRVTMPVGISPVQPQTLVAVRTALRPAMTECIATHAADAPSGSSAQAVLTVSIRDEKLTVDKLQVSTEGLAEDEALKACITAAMLGHQQVVSGAADVEAHTMTFPYDL